MQKYSQLKSLLASLEADADKFYQGHNKAAGTRLRKAMLEVKNLAGEIRKEVSEQKNQS
jgi:hypothetical protein